MTRNSLVVAAVAGLWLVGCAGESVNPGIDPSVDTRAVWIPDRDRNLAYRYERASGQVTTVDGLVGPYTSSDMTGFIRNAIWRPLRCSSPAAIERRPCSGR